MTRINNQIFRNKLVLSILTIIIITVGCWYPIFHQTFLGEGYYYFSDEQNFFQNGQLLFPWAHDVLARIIFGILPPIFRDNISFYIYFQFFVMLALYLVFFIVLLKITKNYLLSTIAVILFISSYVGSYELLAIGNYQRFVQRVPNLIIMLVSFYYFYRFFEIKKILYLEISLLTYIAGIFLAHFSFFTSPLFLIYPFVYLLDQRKTFKTIFLSTGISLLYLLTAELLLIRDNFTPHMGILKFITTQPDIYERTFFQLTNITVPEEIINFIASLYGKVTLQHQIAVFYLLTPLVLFLYSVFLVLIYRSQKKLGKIYLTMLLSAIVYMFFYIYIDEKNNVLKGFGQARFFFISTMLLSVNWSLILIYIANRIKFRNIFLISVLGITLGYNIYHIQTETRNMQYKSTAMKRYVQYIKTLAPIKSGTVIVSPAAFQWPYPLINKYYAEKPLKYVILEPGWESLVAKYPKNHVKVFDYKYYLDQDGYYEPDKGDIVDLTQNYIRGEVITPLNINGYR